MNYKAGPDTITISGITITVPYNAKIKHLYDAVFGANGADALLDAEDHTAYVVPTGKKFVTIGTITKWRANTYKTIVLYYATLENGTDTLIKLVQSVRYVDYDLHTYFGDRPEAPAGKYITGVTDHTALDYIFVFGYEVPE